ncbi:MAG: hypothetical protein ACYC5Y_10510 [Symbiobacteriia bacterium]
MSEEESQKIMAAVLGGFQEQRAVLDGLVHEVAHLAQRLTAVEGRLASVEDRLASVEDRLTTVEQGLADLREELHDGLNQLGQRWMEHDRAIYTLQRRQAEAAAES